MSSAEAEYVSAASAAQEITWLLNLLKDLDLDQTLPILLYEDNISTIKMITSEKLRPKTKHIDVKYNCVKHLTESGFLKLLYSPSKTMIADMMTKPLPKTDFERHRNGLQMKLQDEVCNE